jgi:hypothetical protein
MNSNLTSAPSEFTRKSEFSKSGLAAEFSSEPPLHPSELSLIARAGCGSPSLSHLPSPAY